MQFIASPLFIIIYIYHTIYIQHRRYTRYKVNKCVYGCWSCLILRHAHVSGQIFYEFNCDLNIFLIWLGVWVSRYPLQTLLSIVLWKNAKKTTNKMYVVFSSIHCIRSACIWPIPNEMRKDRSRSVLLSLFGFHENLVSICSYVPKKKKKK